MIPYSRQYLFSKDIKNVNKVLKSNFLTQGKEVPKFEKKISNFCNSKYTLVVNSATSALHLTCLALGLKKMIISGQSPSPLLHLQIVHYIVEQKLI